MRTPGNKGSEFVLCLDNSGHEVTLQVRKVYERIPDTKAEGHGYIRVIDESGDDYMFPADRFFRWTFRGTWRVPSTTPSRQRTKPRTGSLR
jgi:hypothetical protein